MSAPIWITKAGSLGVVPEGRFYRIALEAYDPNAYSTTEGEATFDSTEITMDSTGLRYSLISGELPAGVQVNTNGTIEGIPISVADFKGVPAEVSENVTSKFAIRVVDAENRIADRTFTLTVTGQDRPEFVTPSGLIGQYFDGSEIEFQFEVKDSDPNDVLTVSVINGQLPPGTRVNKDGLLTGFIQPTVTLDNDAIAGWDRDNTGFAEFPFDFSTRSISTNYRFTLQVSDGKDTAQRTFDIFVFSRNAMTADSVEITADNTNVTADSLAIRSPYILNFNHDLGRFRHDNFFAYKFDGDDPDGDQIEYLISSGTLPPGISLDSVTGWISGELPEVGLTEQLYEFSIRVRKVINPNIMSPVYETKMVVHGDVETSVTWVTDSNLGTINNGEISTLSVKATHPGTALQYRLATGGTYNKLPQGLILTDSGLLAGRTSFKTFSLDGGTTTFDSEHTTRLDVDPTTFDLTYNFTVEAYSSNGLVSVTKDFTVMVHREYETPFNVLYCKAMPPLADRELLDSLLLNRDVIPTEHIYRASDPNFGLAKRVNYYHAFGLTPATIADYFAALETNHFNKRVTLGELKTARALDDDENVIYEVVYSQLIDNAVNAAGESVSDVVSLSAPAIDNGVEITEVHTNSLENMREQVVDQIGQQSKVLPRWMLSKQENGEVLGFTPAWVIAYTKPEKSKLIKYKINEFFGTQLNLIDFEIDRYTLDSRMSQDWDLTEQKWVPAVATTFDREPDLNNETIFDGGSLRFSSPVDLYEPTDKLDTYIKFPQVKIINNTQ